MTDLILGPPGTGKTTTLISLIKHYVSQGTPLDKIMFVSFTRKAIAEAKAKMIKEFNIREKDMPYFRTVHSLCYRELGIKRYEIMSPDHLTSISEITGLRISGRINHENYTHISIGDQIYFLYNLSQSKQQTLKETWQQENLDIDWFKVKQFAQIYEGYKKEKGLLDFTDLLVEFKKLGAGLPIDVAILDEAQDMTKLQWDVFNIAASKAKDVHISGDDDQSIYIWNGADIETFLSLEADRRQVLEKSYRVPKAIHQYANNIITKVKNRYPKTWAPKDLPGSISEISSISYLDMRKGSWYILGRNTAMLSDYKSILEYEGLPYTYRGKSSIDNQLVRAIVNYEKLRKGEKIKGYQATKVREYLGLNNLVFNRDALISLEEAQIANTGIWHQAFRGVALSKIDYFLNILRKGNSLLSNPGNIVVDTIHSVKGGEADNVVLVGDMTTRTYSEFEKNPANEHRVFYVGATRAKENLYIMQPSTLRYYLL